VNVSVKPQCSISKIYGNWWCFTDASAINFSKLSESKQGVLRTAYFDPEKGNAYQLGRIPSIAAIFN
ncbi:MAG: hypothetical protein ACJ0BQ_01910, partial [Coraliomargaritaceae bacterium]